MDWSQFAAIAGLMVVMFGWLKLDIRDLRVELRSLSDRLNDMCRRVARIEGHLGIASTEA